MHAPKALRILLIEDDPDDYVITREVVSHLAGGPAELSWEKTYESGLSALQRHADDVCLLDYRLGAMDGLTLLVEARRSGCNTAVILLSGVHDPDLDVAALQAGADDYLTKAELSPASLARSIRYARARERHLEELRQSEDRYRRIVTTSIDGVWLFDEASRTTFASAQVRNLLGYTGEEMLGKPMSDFMDDEGRAMFANRVPNGEMKLRRKDGTDVWTSFEVNAVLDPVGRRAGAVAVITDISERRRAEQARARFAAIVESSDDAIVSRDANGTIETWNSGAQRLFGFTPAEVIGKPVGVLAAPGQQEEVLHLMERVRAGERIRTYETVRNRKDGTPVRVALSVSPIRDAAGKVIGASNIFHALD